MNSKKRKLIFAWTYLDWGGAQIYLLAIMKVAKADWDIVVILPRGSSPEILRFLDQISIPYEFIEHHLDMKPAPTIGRKLERQMTRIRTEFATYRFLSQYDLKDSILHIEAAPWQSWIFLACLCMKRANVFVTLHNALPKYSAWRELVWKMRMQFLSRLSRFHIFASNNDTKNKFRGSFEEKFWANINVTYTCINPPEIEAAIASAGDRSKLREQFGLKADRFIILCVAQFIDRKGRWNFLKAAKIVASADPDVDFVWLAPKEPDAEETKKILEFGLGERFRLILSESVGRNREEILRFFKVGDVFAHPSVVDGLPIAILEAMGMGLPVISTNVYAIPEAVRPYETGLLVEPEDSEQLAKAIVELKTNLPLRQKLANNGQRMALDNFDERVAASMAISAYEECFADGR